MGLLEDDALARRQELVESTAPTRAASVSPEASLVAVEGVVRVHEETVSPPLDETSVVEPGRRAAGDGTDGDGRAGNDGTPTTGGDGDRPSGDGDRPAQGDGTAGTTTDGADGSDGAPPDAGDGPTRLDELAAEKADRERGPAVLTQYVRRPRDPDGPQPPTETRVEAVPFVVEDESGEVLVDAREATPEGVLLSPAVTERFLGDERGSRVARATGSDATRELATARTVLGTTPDWEHEQATLRAGDQVYVLGTTRDGERTRIAPGDGEEFVVSDLSPAALAEQLERASGGLDRRFWLFAVVGAIAAVVVLITLAVLLDSFVL